MPRPARCVNARAARSQLGNSCIRRPTLGIPELARGLAEPRHAWRGGDTLGNRRQQLDQAGTAGNPGTPRTVTALAVAANGTQAVERGARMAQPRCWRIASGRLTKSLPTRNTGARCVQSAPDAELVRAAHSDGTAHEWDLTTGADRRIIDAPVVQVTAFAVANNGGRAVTGDVDYAVSVWDLGTQEPLLRLPRQNGVVTAVAISADGRHVAAACATGDISVWDVEGEQIRMRVLR